MSKVTKQEQNEAIERLKELVKPGDTIYTVLRHVSKSGMYRAIDLFVMVDNHPFRISWNAAKLLEGHDNRHEACRASGCGMDMGFHLVYNLGRVLYPDGYQCLGEPCRSNDHANSPYPRRDGQMQHNDGGYAFKQSWM